MVGQVRAVTKSANERNEKEANERNERDGE